MFMGHVPGESRDQGALFPVSLDELIPADPLARALFRFPLRAGAEIHQVHEGARVVRVQYTDRYCEIEAEAPESLRHRLRRYIQR